MKFAHQFKEALATQDFPAQWVTHAVPYHQLKKCIKKIQKELSDLDLERKTLQFLLDPNNDSPIALKYQLNLSSNSRIVRPELTVYIHLRNGQIMDTSLTPGTQRFFQKIASEVEAQKHQLHPRSLESPHPMSSEITSQSSQHADSIDAKDESHADDELEVIEYPLVVGQDFFNLLQEDVDELESLQNEELKNMSREVIALGKEVSQVAKPSRFSKSDLATWRDIFEIYLGAEVFFATKEMAHGARSSASALKQLQWFQEEVSRKGLPKTFKLGESQRAYMRFLNLNMSLLKNLQFQELNKTAIYKILKKFDKTTSFNVSHTFPEAIRSDRLITGSIAKEICTQISRELVSVVPQIQDHLCPVCFAITWRPVRLDCQHVFCIRCMIQMQRRDEKFCPLCRAGVVLQASEDNIDHRLERYLRKYFPREVKEKARENEMERGIEDFGSGYKPSECSVM